MILYDSTARIYKSDVYSDRAAEGAITKLIMFDDLILWASKQNIYVKNYTREEAIVQIPRPDANPLFPQNLYQPRMTPPMIEFKVDKTKVGTINKPVYHMIMAWFNQVRKFRVAYDEKKKKY